MIKRIVVAVPILVFVVLAVFMQGWVLAIFAVALACMCQFEVLRAFSLQQERKPLAVLSFALSLTVASLFLYNYFSPQKIFSMHKEIVVLFVLFSMLCFIITIVSKKYTLENIKSTLFTFVYPNLFFVIFYILILGESQTSTPHYYTTMITLLLVFLPAMFTDTFAYFFGMLLGKRKLCPRISPNKTIAGGIAGVGGGVVATSLIWIVFRNLVDANQANIIVQPVGYFVFTGVVLAIAAQFGDLSASLIKRALDVKDFGRLLPGHGGVVDRMDSILFCIPTLYILKYFFVL